MAERRPSRQLQQQLLELLEQEDHPLTGLGLAALLRQRGEIVAPSIVFRALRILSEGGEVRKLLAVRGYVRSAGPGAIYLCCTGCGMALAVPDRGSAGLIAAAAGAAGLRVRRTIIEIAGRCKNCGDATERESADP